VQKTWQGLIPNPDNSITPTFKIAENENGGQVIYLPQKSNKLPDPIPYCPGGAASIHPNDKIVEAPCQSSIGVNRWLDKVPGIKCRVNYFFPLQNISKKG
jgi:hypothetical protein